jgi:hypothetical protein
MPARGWVDRFRSGVLDHLYERGDSVSGVENVGLTGEGEAASQRPRRRHLTAPPSALLTPPWTDLRSL